MKRKLCNGSDRALDKRSSCKCVSQKNMWRRQTGTKMDGHTALNSETVQIKFRIWNWVDLAAGKRIREMKRQPETPWRGSNQNRTEASWNRYSAACRAPLNYPQADKWQLATAYRTKRGVRSEVVMLKILILIDRYR